MRISDWSSDVCSSDLSADVRRGITQNPVDTVITDGDRRLGTRLRIERAGAQAGAVGAIAVPLRKTAARSGTKNTDEHGQPPKAKPRPEPGLIDQRFAKYMVTSKPIRMSVKAGLVHIGRSSFYGAGRFRQPN